MADSTGADGNGLLRPPPVPGTADSGNGSPPASRPRPLVDFGRQRSVSIVRLASANDVRSPSQAQSPPSASSSGVAAGAKHRGRAKTVSVVCPPKISEETTGASHTRQYDHATTSTDYARQAQQSSGIDGQPGEEGLGTDGNQGGEGGNSGVGSAGALGVGRSATNRKRAATSASRWSTSVRKARSGTVGSRHAASSSDTGGGDLENLSTSDAGRTEAYDSRVHDLLDVLDPEVQVLNTLGDIQNTLFIPYTGLFDRTRKVQLTRPPCAEPPREGTLEEAGEGLEERAEAEVLADLDQEARLDGEKKRSNFQKTPSYRPASGEAAQPQEGTSATAGDAMREKQTGSVPSSLETASTVEMPDRIERGQYFLLPSKLVDMSGWSEEEKAELDDYVRHLMHSRKEKLRRKWRGFRKYVSTPLGAFITVYASLLTFWGAAWVLFLIGWLNAGNRQDYFVEICDQILVALFCLVGLGLIPWRTVDTYHAYFVIKYHWKTIKLRKRRGLPELADPNDLPNDQLNNHDLELAGHAQDAVLSDREQLLLAHHQAKLHKSHTYYRPHDTPTHRAFPVRVLTAIIILSDFHSCFQLALGSTTWSISYHHNFKRILTTIILCFSLSCNITAGILIGVGNKMTRKTEVVEQLMRKAITEEALRRKEDADVYRAEKRARQEAQARNGGVSQTFPHNVEKALGINHGFSHHRHHHAGSKENTPNHSDNNSVNIAGDGGRNGLSGIRADTQT